MGLEAREKLEISHDASNQIDFTVSSDGKLTITPSGGLIILGSNVDLDDNDILNGGVIGAEFFRSSLTGGGTPSDPSFNVGGSTNSGLFLFGSNQLGFSANNTTIFSSSATLGTFSVPLDLQANNLDTTGDITGGRIESTDSFKLVADEANDREIRIKSNDESTGKVVVVYHETTGDIATGFGTGMAFFFKDAGFDGLAGGLLFDSVGSGGSSKFRLQTFKAGVAKEGLVINSSSDIIDIGMNLFTTKIGDGGTNDVEIDTAGQVIFHGTGGLVFGELSEIDNTTANTFAGSGVANKTQYLQFSAAQSKNSTASVAQNHIQIDEEGFYSVTASITAESTLGAARQISFNIYKNNGTTAFTNLHAHRDFGGGGGEIGSISLSGIIDVATNDTLELWVHNETGGESIIISDVTFSVVQIGGT